MSEQFYLGMAIGIVIGGLISAATYGVAWVVDSLTVSP